MSVDERDENVEIAEQPPGSEPGDVPAAGDTSPEVDTPAPDVPAGQDDDEATPAAERPVRDEATPATEPAAEQVPEGEPVADASAEQEAAAEELVEGPAAPPPPKAKQRSSKSKAEKREARAQAASRQRAARAERPKGQRAPLVREPKPERERGRRQERRGVVVSAAMDKTIVVKVDTIKAHPKYKKVVRRSTKFHAHDERNTAKVGDLVRIVETRPLSATKRWRLAEVMQEAR